MTALLVRVGQGFDIHRTGEEAILPGAHEFLRPKGWRPKSPSGFGVWLFLGAAVLVGVLLVLVLG